MSDNFIISGFSDEIDADIKKQFTHLNKLGITHFEPRGVNGINISELNDEQVAALKQDMKDYGISVSSIGSPLGKIGINDEFAPHLEKVKRVIDIAHRLDAEYIRVFSFYIPKEEDPADYRNEVMDRLGKMVRLAESEGVTLLHENEKGIYGSTAPRCLDIFETIKSSALSGVFDPANFVQCGQSVYPEAFDMLLPYIKYMHIKDAREDGEVVPSGMGIGSVRDVLSALKERGYSGFVSLEPHLAEFTGFAELEENGESIKTAEKSGADKFTLAYNALKNILDEI